MLFGVFVTTGPLFSEAVDDDGTLAKRIVDPPDKSADGDLLPIAAV